MKKLMVLLFSILLMLTACADDVSSKDADPNFVRTTSRFCETDDAYYFILTSHLYQYIQYVDKESGVYGALCGKAECTHNKSSCNAYVTDWRLFTKYDGRLYSIDTNSTGYFLCSLNFDGTERKTVRKLDSDVCRDYFMGTSASPIMTMHRGYLFGSADKSVVQNGEYVEYVSVVQLSLDSGADDIEILNYAPQENGSVRILPYGDSLYMLVTSWNLGDLHTNHAELFRWDIPSQTLDKIFDEEIEDVGPVLWISDESAYLLTENGDVLKYDFSEKEFETIVKSFNADNEYALAGFLDGYLVGTSMDDTAAICIMRFDGNTVGEPVFSSVSPEFGIGKVSKSILGKDESYVYCSLTDYSYPTGKRYLCAFPLDGGEANLLWEEEV